MSKEVGPAIANLECSDNARSFVSDLFEVISKKYFVVKYSPDLVDKAGELVIY